MSNDSQQIEYWSSRGNQRAYNHPVVELFARQRLDYLRSMIDIPKGARLLDVGCGDGFSTFYAARFGIEVFGVDRSEFMLSHHPLRSRVACGDAYALPFADESFDIVWSWELLHHSSDPATIMREMQRVSRKYCVIFEPNRYNPALFLYGLFKKEERWLLRWTKRFARSTFANQDWRICSVENCGAIFPNATPVFLVGALRHLPFRLPLVGISIALLAEKVSASR